jgi:hypothetical protein
MTESAWRRSTNPQTLLATMRDKVSDRKFRLFSLACMRRFEVFLAHPRLGRTREAIATQERYIDGEATADQLRADSAAALEEIERNVLEHALENWTGSDLAHALLSRDGPSAAARHIALAQDFAFDVVVDHLPETLRDEQAWRMVTGPVKAQLCRWLRDLVGNPFRPARFLGAWRTSSAVGIARAMYEHRDFVALPVLAESLREAGCRDARIFRHCNEPGEHIRGCWVVDLVLQRE